MNKKKIVIMSIFIVIVVGICLLLIFNGKENKKGYATVDEPDNFVVDTENKENVDIIDNIKINNSQKVKGKIYAKPLNKGKDNVVYMENASIKSDIDNDFMTISAQMHEEKEEHEQQENNEKYHTCEFRYGQYQRTVSFDNPVKSQESHAKYKDGILIITDPKQHVEEKHSTTLEISEE